MEEHHQRMDRPVDVVIAVDCGWRRPMGICWSTPTTPGRNGHWLVIQQFCKRLGFHQIVTWTFDLVRELTNCMGTAVYGVVVVVSQARPAVFLFIFPTHCDISFQTSWHTSKSHCTPSTSWLQSLTAVNATRFPFQFRASALSARD